MEAVVREEDTTQASPMGNVPVDKNVVRTLGCNFSGNDGERTRTATETASDRQRPKIASTDRMPAPEGRGIEITDRRSPVTMLSTHCTAENAATNRRMLIHTDVYKHSRMQSVRAAQR